MAAKALVKIDDHRNLIALIATTTSRFSQGAQTYVSRVDSKIVLIDGDTLAQLMIDFNIGVATFATYELKRVDSDYFIEE